jgi:arylformamidase
MYGGWKKLKMDRTLMSHGWTGRAYVLHLPEVDVITAEVLEKAQIPPRTRRVLFRTRNSNYWSTKQSAFQEDFVGLSEDGAEYLVRRGVKLVGMDYLSIAVIVEGLDLSEVSQGRYTLYCLPLKIANSDGAPARAILIGV